MLLSISYLNKINDNLSDPWQAGGTAEEYSNFLDRFEK